MPVTKSHNKKARQKEALVRQDKYNLLTPEEKKAKSDEWKKRN